MPTARQRPPPLQEEFASIERPVCFKHIRERCGHAAPTCWLLVFIRTFPFDRRDRMHFLFTMTDNTHLDLAAKCGTFIQDEMSRLRRIFGDPHVWWSQTGSNRRPHACKARALPTELWPRAESRSERVVGLGRLELPTSRLSSARSNQLSYKPKLSHASHLRPAGSSCGRKRNEDGGCPARSA